MTASLRTGRVCCETPAGETSSHESTADHTSSRDRSLCMSRAESHSDGDYPHRINGYRSRSCVM